MTVDGASMRIARLAVTAYGPLAGLDETDLNAVQLVCGPNESGKTLLTEALLRLMTGSTPAGVRVEDEVIGFVELDDGAGPYRIDGETSLLAQYEDRHGIAITPAEFRNLFVVRDADLPVEGAGFYERVTDRLSGLLADDIRAVMAAVRERGRLTTGELRLSDAKPDGKPKTRREAARTLLEDVRAYRQTAVEEGLDTAERDRLEAVRELDRLRTTVDELEAAEHHATIDSLRETVGALREAIARREGLPDAETIAELRRRAIDLLETGVPDEELAARKAHARSLTLASLGVAVVTFLGLGWLSLPLFGAVVPTLALGLAGYFGSRWWGSSRRAADQAGERAALLRSARQAGLEGGDPEELAASLEAAERDLSTATTAVDQAVGELRGSLDLGSETDPQAVADAAARRLDEWAGEVPAVDRPYDQSALAEAREAMEATEAEVDRLEGALATHRRQLERFAERAGQLDFEAFTGHPLAVSVTSLEALGALERRLDGFVEAIERDATTARTAHDILEAMAEAEGEKVTALFGPASRTSELFARVTDGRYEAVRYDADADEVVVDRAGRDTRTQRELSRGTCDQLFFCVRVALAERLLGGARGVFVLDDAFLTADRDRLERQTEIVSMLAEDGWQVLYLTAKPDATAAFEALCPAPIELDPL